MKIRKKHYITSWIVMVILILSATLLLLITSITSLTPEGRLWVSLLAWSLTIASGFFLFILGSGRAISNKISMHETISHNRVTTDPSPARPVEKEKLNIKAVAGKIVRRTDIAQSPDEWSKDLINMFVSELEIMSGIFFHRDKNGNFVALRTYACPHENTPSGFVEGEGLHGQAAKNRHLQVIRKIPDEYREVFSGLGSGKPAYMAIIPIVLNEQTIAVLEIAGYKWSKENLEQLFQLIARNISEKLELPAKKEKK